MAHVGGTILCGGQSERMGRPKADLLIGTETFLQRIVRQLSAIASPIVVVAAPQQTLPQLDPGIDMIRDSIASRGPMQGFRDGLNAIGNRADAVFVASCDIPNLRPEFVQRLVDLLGDHDIAVPLAHGKPHPLAAVYRVSVQPIVEDLLAAGKRRMTDLLKRCRTRYVSAEELRDIDPKLDSLFNVNTPRDYAELLRASGST